MSEFPKDSKMTDAEKIEQIQKIIDQPFVERNFSLIACVSLLMVMSIFCLAQKNWVGFIVDATFFLLICWIMRKEVKLHAETCRIRRQLKSLEILTTPRIREEGHSIIFTFAFPTEEFENEMRNAVEKKKKE